MVRRLVTLACCGGVLLATACGRPSAADRPVGDPEAGRAAFASVGCFHCHDVAGGGVPAPTIVPAVHLGGRVLNPPSAERIQQDIVLPSSHFAVGYPNRQIMRDGKSAMRDYSEVLTTQQLADLAAFLRTRYERGLPSPVR